MEIGKSKAEVYLQQQTGVTFDDVAGIDEAKVELMDRAGLDALMHTSLPPPVDEPRRSPSTDSLTMDAH